MMDNESSMENQFIGSTNSRSKTYPPGTRGQYRALDSTFYTKDRNFLGKGKKVIKTIVRNLNLDCVKPQRAGIIIYTVVNGSTYFGLGLDSRTHDLTDFGGSVIYKVDNDAIKGAIREFEEETLGIFEEFSSEHVKDCPVIYDDNNLIIFVHMSVDPDTTSAVFNQRFKQCILSTDRKTNLPEVCGITWLTWEEFQSSIKGKHVLFSRVRNFLYRAGDFSYLL